MTFCIVLLLTTALLALSGIGIDYYFNVRRKAKKAIPKIGNKLRAFDKVKRVIESCRTKYQLHSAQRVLDSYLIIYGANVYWESLYDAWYDKFREHLPQSEEWQLPNK